MTLVVLAFAGTDSVAQSVVTGDTENLPASDDQPTHQLIVRQWLSHAGGGAEDRAESINALARLNRWAQVDQLLSSTDLRKIRPEVQAKMSLRIDAANFLRIRQNDQVGAKAKEVLDAIGKSARAMATDGRVLQKAIKQIVNARSNTDQKLAAARTLVRGGNASIVAVTDTLTGDLGTPSRQELLRVLLSFGDTALNPLEQIALYGQPTRRLNALRSLRMVNRERFLPTWVTALHASDSTEDERLIASEAIRKFDRNEVSFEDALEYSHADLVRRATAVRLMEKTSTGQVESNRVFDAKKYWALDPGDQSIKRVRLSDFQKSYRDVVDASARLRRLEHLSSAAKFDVIAAEVGYQIAIDPDWLFDLTPSDLVLNLTLVDSLDDWESIIGAASQLRAGSNTASNNNLDEWFGSALAHASQKNDEAAMLGIIRVLSESIRADGSGDRRTAMSQALISASTPNTGANLPVLIELAASSPRTRIRYEAALLAAEIADGGRYAGLTRVRHTLAEMSRLGDQPTAVLVETRSSVRVDVERLAGEMGLQLEVVSSVSELLRLVRRGGDIRVIVCKSNLRDQRPIELLDSVRRLPRGERLPIVFYPANTIALDLPLEARWDAPLVKLEGPVTRAAMENAIADAQRTPAIKPLTGLERRSFRDRAAKHLSSK